MYLSRLILDPRSREVRRDLADCHELHRTVLGAFPVKQQVGGGVREAFGVLYRVDTDRQNERTRIRLYIQSQEVPDWSHLPRGYLLEEISGPKNPDYRPLDGAYGQLRNGMVLSFSLKANPTRKVGTSLKCEREEGKAKSNGRRVFIADPEEQMEWLRRKATLGGFELLTIRRTPDVPDADVAPEGRMYGHRTKTGPESRAGNGKTAGNELVFGSARFTGHLRITDRERFLNTITRGIGSGKAYGFGLLSLAPAR